MTEYDIQDIAYQTCYLIKTGWARAKIDYALFEKERPDLSIDDKDFLWVKKAYFPSPIINKIISSNQIVSEPVFELHQVKDDHAPYNRIIETKFFTLKEAYQYQTSEIEKYE